MNKIISIIITAFTLIFTLNGQNVDDALRYSQKFYSGTARFTSMGGAFSSLGADMSAISINPAGLGMYRSYEISVSPRLIYNNTSSVFNNTTSTDFRYTFGLSQAGVVANFVSNENSSGLVSLNGAYTYNSTNNFNDNTIISGISDNSSMTDYWVGNSQNKYYVDLTGSEGLAFDAWLTDTTYGSGGYRYASVLSGYGEYDSYYGQTIKRVITNEGYTGEHEFSFGGNFSNKFYLGASFGIIPLWYQGHYEHLEADYDNVIPDFKNFTYVDHFEASGIGYSGKIGAIIRPVKMLRIGFAFHLPVWYYIDEYFFDNMTSEFDDLFQKKVENYPLRYSYTLTTPYRIVAGASLQLGKLGIVTADYELVDYRMAKFSKASDGYNYSGENESIQTILKSTSNIRLGAEIRLGSIYLRGGYGIYGSAFAEGEDNEDLIYTTYSGGFGYRYNNFFFDLAYSNLSSTQKYYMYDDYPYLQPATIETSRNTFTATIGFKF